MRQVKMQVGKKVNKNVMNIELNLVVWCSTGLFLSATMNPVWSAHIHSLSTHSPGLLAAHSWCMCSSSGKNIQH
ncbi:hypothetical protein BpHYR1_005650 [Brachionus plicatilis]|uniref:Uncharacterized protein n=1 Tax=Brachionus plicatilis TaxID=10195 RepID=A0A3M7Q0V7_BRAPC|nr:hypothetical protein BpHYR1_005650 [Brachionus plicatilis]